MKNVKSSEINNLKATHEFGELVKYGRQLHSEAVFMAVMKVFKLFRHDMSKTVQFAKKQGNLEYTH